MSTATLVGVNMNPYPSEYLDNTAYGAAYTHHLHPDLDHADMTMAGDAGYLAGADKFTGFWDDAMSASSWSDTGMPDAMVHGGIVPVPEMIGGDFYPEGFMAPAAYPDAQQQLHDAFAHTRQQKHRPHRSATMPSRPAASPERAFKNADVKSHARHHSSRIAHRSYRSTSPTSAKVAAAVDKKMQSNSPIKSPSGTSSPTSNAATITNATGTSKYTRTHYVVEKRYRTNLNDKFEELRDCLVTARAYLSEDYCPDGQLGSGEDQLRMSKTRVLGEAVEYIRHLEEQNDRAMDHIEMLERRSGATKGDAMVEMS